MTALLLTNGTLVLLGVCCVFNWKTKETNVHGCLSRPSRKKGGGGGGGGGGGKEVGDDRLHRSADGSAILEAGGGGGSGGEGKRPKAKEGGQVEVGVCFAFCVKSVDARLLGCHELRGGIKIHVGVCEDVLIERDENGGGA